MVLAPELELVTKLTTQENKPMVQDYIITTERKTEVERQANKEKLEYLQDPTRLIL